MNKQLPRCMNEQYGFPFDNPTRDVRPATFFFGVMICKNNIS